MATVCFSFIGYYWFKHFSINTIAAIVADLCRENDLVAAEYRYAINRQIGAAVKFMEETYGTEATVDALAYAGADPAVIANAQEATEIKD